MPRSETPSDPNHRTERVKRSIACLPCRRQKVKCDAKPDQQCSRRTGWNVSRGQGQTQLSSLTTFDVESRLKGLNREIALLKEQTSRLQEKFEPESNGHTGVAVLAELHPTGDTVPLEATHLSALCLTLQPALEELQRPSRIEVRIDEAAVLWNYFHESLAVFHGFTAGKDITASGSEGVTPSPLLFTAIVTAAAKRYNAMLRTSDATWEELFQRALVRLLYETRARSWDDVVGLGIARTWFWKADEITSGLIYGSFLETSRSSSMDIRSRRVWDLLEMTSVSHGILHLSTPIVPEQPPSGVLDRGSSNVLLASLNELFDVLGVVNRALTSATSLVKRRLTLVSDQRRDLAVSLESANPSSRLPSGRSRQFLLDLLTLYYHVSTVVVEGYLTQIANSSVAMYQKAARDLLGLATEQWSSSLHLWPKLFQHTALIAALISPIDDPLVRRIHELMLPYATILQFTGRQLVQKLDERLQGPSTSSLRDLLGLTPDSGGGMAAYTGSELLWSDFTTVFDLGTEPLNDLNEPATTAIWSNLYEA